jgi:RNA polymerase subunit RPABC4/transcription elongation factor Spt4
VDQVMQLIQILFIRLVAGLQPFLVPICFVVAWSVVLLGLWQVFAATRDTVKRAQVMHQIPCADCRFFTRNMHLKCPVHPTEALSEQAIGCADFSNADPMVAAQFELKRNLNH